jgi:hypothetical protein
VSAFVVALIVGLLAVIAGMLYRIELHLRRIAQLPRDEALRGPWA